VGRDRGARPAAGRPLAAIFPSARAAELRRAVAAHGLAPARLRAVHAQADRPASRVLLEAVRDGGAPLVTEPPLFVHEAADLGRFSPEVRRMLGEDV